MRVGLIDVDGHSGFPNLALMKLSAWHKSRGDDVEWYSPMFSGHMDKVYMSKVFTFSQDFEYYIDAEEVVKGGTGYKDYTTVLPDEIEYTFPDYSIYPKVDYAIGFLTRGCIRNCSWCIVPQKEGKIHAVNTWEKIKRPDSKRILFMDNNVLASEHGIHQIESMGGQKIRIDFNQGLDARLIDDSVAKLLGKCKWDMCVRISCDTTAMIPIVATAIERLVKNGIRAKDVFVYTLVRDVEEAYSRIMAISAMGAYPFAQPYRDFNGGRPPREQRLLAEWCNKKGLFFGLTWDEFKRKKGI